ncbi:Branched-chain amino acid transport ATP-binding protein LivF [Liberibacter crescens BT-1]|uniref:Branched-chain amino acid transport ATP-binding protein LivF n=1 Tax=Liberibacter crescens (strain BT-1) TaxID=1215343 RepID=L0EWL0_LIBCB|nr:ABC transporter ATP-binding protein [Liberibacter crescens]AGA65018.1 Branched-chain amino acid transport ATP-binding protein LivF [Liberibacter crescens BT-1]AMC13025.1 ABC transporter ATP-binding protein [Liberibacter crescens]
MREKQLLLKVRDLETYYGSIQALAGVDIDIYSNEIVALIGANGAGKSTLMMTIFGSISAHAGKVFFENHEITRMPSYKIAHLRIAIVPEGRRIFQRMTVYENLQMGAVIDKLKYFNDDLMNVFQLFPRLKERQKQLAGTLSGGEQQMLAIGRALMSRPKLLILDEPSLGLAPLLVKQIFEVIKILNVKYGLTVLLVEQSAFAALKLANRAYVMSKGKIVISGSGEELLDNHEVQMAYLGGRSFESQ